jgi:hypothetical protein
MNKIVKRHLPVSELPADWRTELPADVRVRVEIEVESGEHDSAAGVPSLDEILARRRPPYRSKNEIDEDLRRERDEWE